MTSETEALLELLTQLKKIVGTVPDQAKSLLTAQPQLAYSLCQLMIKMNILSPEVLQKTLSSLAAPQQAPAHPTPPLGAPQPHVPPITSNGHPQSVPGFQQYPPPTQQFNGQLPPLPSHNTPTPQYPNAAPPLTQPTPNGLAMLASIPEDQKNMILQILSYTPEQISQLPPADRATFIQLRATFGVGS